MSKTLDTSIEGYAAAGIRITEEQANELGILNSIMNADKTNGNASDPVFYITYLMRILGVLPDGATCEIKEPFGRFTTLDELTQRTCAQSHGECTHVE